MRWWLLLLFLATIAIDWPHLPLNAQLADVVFVAAALAVVVDHRWTLPRLSNLDLAIAAYLIGSVVSVAFSPEVRVSVAELARHLYLVTIYIVIAIAVRQGLAGTVASGLALSGAILATIGLAGAALKAIFDIDSAALLSVMSLPYIGETVRLRALTESEAMFACVLAMSAPFIVSHPYIRSSRNRVVASAVVIAVAAALTFSHSIAGITVAALVIAWPTLRSRPMRTAALGITIAIITAANFAASIAVRSIDATGYRDDSTYYYAVDTKRTAIAGRDVEYQIMGYLRLKQVAWDSFTSHPLTGLGLDRFHSATEAAYQAGRLTATYRAIDPHSTLPGRMAEAGIIGAISLLALWLIAGMETIRLLARPAAWPWVTTAVAAGLAATLINSVNADVMNFRFLWVALGLVRGLSAQNPR
jgi:O-antigen ligase